MLRGAGRYDDWRLGSHEVFGLVAAYGYGALGKVLRLTRYGVIDVGSNTIHLLVGEAENGEVLPVTGEKVSARLGSGVEKTGKLQEERLALAAEVIRLFAKISSLNGVSEPVILATSAVREAENGSELEEKVVRLTGLRMRLISGEEEAELGFRGAISAVGASWRGPALVVDLGGGSAQLIVGEASSGPLREVSLPLGTNRTTERFVANDPPKKKELRALHEHVKKLVPRWELPARVRIVAVGGSARAVLKITQDRLTAERLKRLAAQITEYPLAVLARQYGLAPERARVLPAAVTTLGAILEHFGKEDLTVARGGVREGAILSLADEARNVLTCRSGA